MALGDHMNVPLSHSQLGRGGGGWSLTPETKLEAVLKCRLAARWRPAERERAWDGRFPSCERRPTGKWENWSRCQRQRHTVPPLSHLRPRPPWVLGALSQHNTHEAYNIKANGGARRQMMEFKSTLATSQLWDSGK